MSATLPYCLTRASALVSWKWKIRQPCLSSTICAEMLCGPYWMTSSFNVGEDQFVVGGGLERRLVTVLAEVDLQADPLTLGVAVEQRRCAALLADSCPRRSRR